MSAAPIWDPLERRVLDPTVPALLAIHYGDDPALPPTHEVVAGVGRIRCTSYSEARARAYLHNAMNGHLPTPDDLRTPKPTNMRGATS